MWVFVYKKNSKILNIANFEYETIKVVGKYISRKKYPLLSSKLFQKTPNGIFEDSSFNHLEILKLAVISFGLRQLYNFDENAILVFISD